MINGVPCIASNLPGVRRPVQMHAMGEVVPIGDSIALGNAINQIVENPADYKKGTPISAPQYQPDFVANEYEQLFNTILQELHPN